MRIRRPLPEEKPSNFCSRTDRNTGYKVPNETKEIDRDGNSNIRYGFKTPKFIDRNDKASNYSIATSMEAGVDPTTRAQAPKVYDICSNPEQLQSYVEAMTEQMDRDMIIKRYEEIKKEREKAAEDNGTGRTTTENV
jgi:hypothetical protein